jgi:putative endonuclease
MYYVYAIKSTNYNRIYVGMSSSIEKRLAEHNSGKSKYTSFYRPWFLFYSESFETQQEARKREVQLKSGFGKEFLREILASFEDRVS